MLILKKPQREGGRPVGCTCVQSAAKELNLGQPRTNPVSGRMEGQESRARNRQTQDQRPNYTASLGFNGDIVSGNWILATQELNSNTALSPQFKKFLTFGNCAYYFWNEGWKKTISRCGACEIWNRQQKDWWKTQFYQNVTSLKVEHIFKTPHSLPFILEHQ